MNVKLKENFIKDLGLVFQYQLSEGLNLLLYITLCFFLDLVQGSKKTRIEGPLNLPEVLKSSF